MGCGRRVSSSVQVTSRPGTHQPGITWLGFAALLADRGYLVLTYDRRGVCPGGELGCSGGQASDSAWEDLAFAVDLLRERGASRVVVGGASLGAMESMYALSRGLDAEGLIWLSRRSICTRASP